MELDISAICDHGLRYWKSLSRDLAPASDRIHQHVLAQMDSVFRRRYSVSR